MRTKYILTSIILGVAFFATLAKLSQTMSIEQNLLNYFDDKPFSGVVFIHSTSGDIKMTYTHSADKSGLASLDGSTQFLIGSVSKQFTAAAVLQLAENGDIDINIPISHYLKDAPKSWTWTETVTPSMLLNHTSGLPSELYPNEGGLGFINHTKDELTLREHFNHPDNQAIVLDPDTQGTEDYSNFGYNVLAVLIEDVSGLSYEDYIQQNLLQPAGMTHSFSTDATSFENIAKHPNSHDIAKPLNADIDFNHADEDGNFSIYSDPTNLTDVPFLNMSAAVGAGSIVSTAEDLLSWNQSLYNGKILSPDSLALMIENEYGIGQDEVLSGYEVTGHVGGLNGYQSASFYHIESGTSYIILSNVSLDYHKLASLDDDMSNDFINYEQRGGEEGIGDEIELSLGDANTTLLILNGIFITNGHAPKDNLQELFDEIESDVVEDIPLVMEDMIDHTSYESRDGCIDVQHVYFKLPSSSFDGPYLPEDIFL